MDIDIYQVDAFAKTIFEGNPAGVCILDNWLPDILMQAIAAEMNLAETAFTVRKGQDFRIRWFTPTEEVKLCGHATLATVHVLYEHFGHPREPIRFHSASGHLIASPLPNGCISLDFPAHTPEQVVLTSEIAHAVGGEPLTALAHEDLIVVYSDAAEIDILTPDLEAIKNLPYRGVCVTAPGNGNGYDFACRFFAPGIGINEDPVTGSVFTELAPFYLQRWGKTEFYARQLSKRGGDVWVRVMGDRVHIAGYARTFMIGTMILEKSGS